VQVNRRFARALQYGLSWTWSKAMNFADGQTSTIATYAPLRAWNYGKAGFDRTHIVKINWVYDLPRVSRHLRNAVVAAALDGWQVSGIASFVSGAPMGIGLAFTYTNDITGTPSESPRVDVVQNPVLPKSERTFSRNFRTEAFAAPAVGSLGNAPKDVFRGPGINNWDISAFKRVPLPGERFKLQFRAEFYNAFNHTQFSGLDTGARFDQQGRQTNARFGEFTTARQARRVQLALRLSF
jgi:hypothetical protein